MIQNILLEWLLDNPQIEPIDKGISSNACLITTNNAQYILRRLSSKYQGHLEFKIANILSALEISPRVIPTNDCNPFVEYGGEYYNLQEYMCGKQVNFCDETLIQYIAKTIALMHKAMRNIAENLEIDDRFSLPSLLENCKWEYLTGTLLEQSCSMEKFKELCFSLVPLDEDKQQWIHGDLGTWNLLYDERKITVIDFGECRKGSIYFDVAAVITSLLSSVRDTNIIDDYIDLFVREYSKYNVLLDRNLLSKYIVLWFVRGILANILEENYQRGKSEKAIDYFAKQIKKYESIDCLQTKS